MVLPNWYSERLRLKNVRKKYHVTFKNELKDEGFLVHKGNGAKQIFRPSEKRLYHSDVAHGIEAILVNTESIKLNIPLDSALILKKCYSTRSYRKAKYLRPHNIY